MLRILLLLFFTSSAILPSLAQAGCSSGGGSCGGGGSVMQLTPGGPWVLLDRVASDPAYTPPSSQSANPASTFSPVFSADTPLKAISIQDSPAYELAMKKLESWKVNSPELVRMIRLTMSQMAYYQTSERIDAIPSQYSLPDQFKKNQTKILSAILYLPDCGSIISAPIWNQLDAETQAGLLIHEALRQIQGAHQFTDFSDAQLENVTDQILDHDPKTSPDLETPEKVGGKLASVLELEKPARRFESEVSLYFPYVCAELSRWSQSKPIVPEPCAPTFDSSPQSRQIAQLDFDMMAVLSPDLANQPIAQALARLRDRACKPDAPFSSEDWWTNLGISLRHCQRSGEVTSSQRQLCDKIYAAMPTVEFPVFKAMSATSMFDIVGWAPDVSQQQRSADISKGSSNPEYQKVLGEIQGLGVLKVQ